MVICVELMINQLNKTPKISSAINYFIRLSIRCNYQNIIILANFPPFILGVFWTIKGNWTKMRILFIGNI
jgi:hypothetical protein